MAGPDEGPCVPNSNFLFEQGAQDVRQRGGNISQRWSTEASSHTTAHHAIARCNITELRVDWPRYDSRLLESDFTKSLPIDWPGSRPVPLMKHSSGTSRDRYFMRPTHASREACRLPRAAPFFIRRLFDGGLMACEPYLIQQDKSHSPHGGKQS